MLTTAAPQPCRGRIASIEHRRESDRARTMVMRVEFEGASSAEIRHAFFFDGFYGAHPVLHAMTCATERHTYTGGAGSRFDIEGFRPALLARVPAVGTVFALEWVGDEIHGRMRGPLWAVQWTSTFEDEGTGPAPRVVMTETFRIEGLPESLPGGPATGAALRAAVRVLNRVPVLRTLARRAAARTCAFFHERHSPYDRTIAARVEQYRRARNADAADPPSPSARSTDNRAPRGRAQEA